MSNSRNDHLNIQMSTYLAVVGKKKKKSTNKKELTKEKCTRSFAYQ